MSDRHFKPAERLFVGIDNGVTGALAALDEAGRVIALAPLPVTKIKSMTVLDGATFKSRLDALCNGRRAHVLIEPAQMFTPGKKALASTWMCYGALRAILETSGYAWEPVGPQRWQKVMFADHVRAVDQDSKKTSILVAKRLFPDTRLSRTEKSKVPDSGMADALLIAEYARRKR